MKMTTEAVPAFASKFGVIDDCKSFTNIELKEHVSLDYKNGYQTGVKRYGMPLDELDAIRDGDFLIRMKKNNDSENDSVCKENEHTSVNGISKSNSDFKKKRNTRKRNRSDMSPEELRRLRERERKAQQSRRDRIRAQKRQNQAWHDDEAAWEAFLDQTDDKKEGTKDNRKHSSSAVPSMVCSIEANHVKEEMSESVNGDSEHDDDKETRLVKQNSHETESISESNHSAYSSDDNSIHGSSKEGSQKSSKEHFSDNESNGDKEEEVNNVKEEQEEIAEDEPKNEPIVRPDHHSENERHHPSPHNNDNNKRHHRPYYFSSPPPPHHPHHATYHPKVSPHSQHNNRNYYPALYTPESAHHPQHYSPPEGKHYIPANKHHHESRHDNHHHHHNHQDGYHQDGYEKKAHYKHHYPPHFVPIIHSQPNSPNSHQEMKAEIKQSTSSPHCEKKKMISRNVDRKKLSEEELEELRRRERDYQRERRARIRMEKAKTQAEQERFHKGRDILPPNYYHAHHADVYRHVHHPNDRQMIPRYDHPEHYPHRQVSPNAPKYNQRNSPKEQQNPDQLEVKIPPEHQISDDKLPETDLLQVVPKTRECEEKYIPPTATSSPVEEEPPKAKKSLLESICSSLKKDSSEWSDKQDDRLIIDLKTEEKNESREEIPKDSMESEENLAKLKEELISNDFRAELHHSEEQKLREKMTEDQLERRRRSNREAQRRRRARLKLQGHVEDRHDFDHHGDEFEKDKELYEAARKGPLKSRPDTLYMQNFHDVYSHRSSYQKERHREHVYLHDKYNHHIPPKEHYGYKHMPYHRAVHHGIDMEDSPARHHHPHHYYEPLRSPDYHRERLLHHRNPEHHHPHLPQVKHHEKMMERERITRSPPLRTSEEKRDQHNTPQEENDTIPPTYESSYRNNESKESRDDSISEHEATGKSGGRKKRKQFAPRKLASSANTTPDEEVDVVSETQQVVILSGPDGQNIDDHLLNNGNEIDEY